MKVQIEHDKCQGHAQCGFHAPELFPLDDDGFLAARGEIVVPVGAEDDAEQAVGSCPERALSLSD